MDNNDCNWTSIGDAVAAVLANLGRPLAGGNVVSFEAAYERRRMRETRHAPGVRAYDEPLAVASPTNSPVATAK